MRDEPLAVTEAVGSTADVTVLNLAGPLVLQNLFGFQERVASCKPKLLILDLSAVPYMDSAGLGAVMNLYVAAEKNGRHVVLAGVNSRVQALLEMTRVHLIVKSFPTAADAEASIRS